MCAPLLIRNVPHFYGFPLDLCRKHIAALFAKCVAIFANALQFDETRRAAFSHAILGKVKYCGALQDGALSGIASKCDAHGGISAAHGMPR